MTNAQNTQEALPKIVVFATGGTIVSSGDDPTQLTGYRIKGLNVESLISGVPALSAVATLEAEQIANIDSMSLTSEVWLRLARGIEAAAARDDVDGIVITHGTDTMEETAYFLQLTNRCKKPVVLVGAMLPSPGLSADGQRNLFNAVLTAASPETAKQGVVVAMDNVVVGAREVIKTNTVQPETYQAGNIGKVGTIFNNHGGGGAGGLRAQKEAPFDVTKLDQLPKVGIVYNHAGVEGYQAEALVKAGYKGIVSAGV